MDIQQITQIASKFRMAILLLPRSAFPWNSSMGCSQFPSGCCGDTSQTLATYIFSETGMICSYVNGRNGGIAGELGSHAWLEFDDFVIDITADQFNNRGYDLPEIYVGKRTDWYDSYKIDIKSDGRHTSLDDKGSLDGVYAIISSELE